MKCGNCGHDAPHGRRGFGACSQRAWTTRGLEEAEKINASMETAKKSPLVIVRVLETLFALPGMSEPCGCRRKTKPAALAAADRRGAE